MSHGENDVLSKLIHTFLFIYHYNYIIIKNLY